MEASLQKIGLDSALETPITGSEDEHGIYHSNSADRAIIRRNIVHDNNANGIHINSDLDTQCVGITFDGIISEILVEKNIIWNQGNGGGSGIFRLNNTVYNASKIIVREGVLQLRQGPYGRGGFSAGAGPSQPDAESSAFRRRINSRRGVREYAQLYRRLLEE